MCPTGTSLRQETTSRPDFRSAFDVLDADRDGKISRDDLRSFYRGFAVAGSSDEDEVIGSMMSAADSNRDGFVEYDEFEKVLESSKNGDKIKEGMNGGRLELDLMGDVFRVMDRNGDGKVGHGDLKEYLRWAGFEATDDDVRAMIRLGGGGEDGGVTYDGLRKILAI